MRCLPLILLCAGWLAIPGSARALPVDTKLDISILNGPDPQNAHRVGTIAFKYDSDLGDEGCRYSGAWDATFDNYIMARCALDEMKTRGHSSCAANSQVAFMSFLLKPAREACSGVDRFGQHQEIFLMMGIELDTPVGIIGLIQWTAATPILSAFVAAPPPP